MTPRQIESWALRIVDQVKVCQPNEDSRVELKREWPSDKNQAARRIAGHANAARGEPILWLIGVDQNDGVMGADFADLANWYPAVQAQFDEVAPALTELNIPCDGKTIVALLFETDRAPFVVKSNAGGTIQREVPWREATGLRSAHRSDLIRLLAPLESLPEVEILSTKLHATRLGRDEANNPTANKLHLELELYFVPAQSNAQIVIPSHRCRAWFEIPAIDFRAESSSVNLYPFTHSDGMISTGHEMIINRPGKVKLQTSASRPDLLAAKLDVQITVHLAPVHVERPIVLSVQQPYPVPF